MTVRELRKLVVDLGIVGYTKKRKDVIVNAILLSQEDDEPNAEKVTGVEFDGHSVLTKPEAPFGHKTTTTIRVTCGASTGNFPVEGKTVGEVGEFLREVLNVDKLSTGLVNGAEVDPDYELKQGDSLEFLKPAGKKG
jgi:hypothetical protein